VLIEFGALGLPIVAAIVGGVGELINEETGYPVGERPSVEDYVRALRAIANSPGQAARRSERLLALIGERHSRAHFAEAVARIPGYLRP
jgi:glycosyltransferase involved in cell wall biosynthesis